MQNTANANVDPAELAKFNRMASRWWDPEGEFKPIHKLNPLRTNFIDARANIAEKRVLDVGCGGGILSEAMAQRGAQVTGLDLAADALDTARLHAIESQLEIDYQLSSAEDFAAQQAQSFDVVTCLELIEHVPEPSRLVNTCCDLLKPGGDLFISTINRNPKAYAVAVLGAEYLLKWLPKGTHEYKKFIRPAELAAWARDAGLSLQELGGFIYNPLNGQFSLSKDVSVNYIAHFKKL